MLAIQHPVVKPKRNKDAPPLTLCNFLDRRKMSHAILPATWIIFFADR